ncbi:MAG: M23 family metallopeptidase [Myxococcales bacterium]|nr:MAG: M23 family metallopeptidase [Myxococcales bacterium]
MSRKKNYLFWSIVPLSLIIFGCISTGIPYFQLKDRVNKQIEAIRASKNTYKISPGQASYIKFPYYGPFKNEKLICDKIEIPFVVDKKNLEAFAFLSQSYFSSDKNFHCVFQFENSYAQNLEKIIVEDFEYPKETLNVDKKRVVLSNEDMQQVQKENEFLSKIFANSSTTPFFNQAFIAPLNSKITSIFGTQRIFNKLKKTQHLGTDFRARIGTQIRPANTGKVVFVGELFFGGNTIIIDHGLGVFTLYCHLSKPIVLEGMMVDKDTIIGESGATGRVNGPHLHWGVKIHGNDVDGFSLINASENLF